MRFRGLGGIVILRKEEKMVFLSSEEYMLFEVAEKIQ